LSLRNPAAFLSGSEATEGNAADDTLMVDQPLDKTEVE
jgi:hypothetical protein